MVNIFQGGRIARCLDIALPQYCLLCGLPSGQALPLCHDCRSELPRNAPCCQRCALPLASPAATLCGQCLRCPPVIDRVVAPYLYDPHIALLIGRWKYGPLARLGLTAADLWCRAQDQPPPVDLITAVPLHWRRYWQRGFNQASQLAGLIQRGHPALAQCSLQLRLLQRQRATAAQAGLDARTRSRNLRGAFTLRGHCDNLRVAVVDDVLTTGATAIELARCLKAGGAREVQLWCLARTPAPSD